MERRVRQVTVAAGLAVVLGAGCIHVHTDADGKVTSLRLTGDKTAGADAAKPLPASATRNDGPVIPAGATVPAPAAALSVPSLSKLMGKGDGGRAAASNVVVQWSTRIAHLPDVTHGGTMVPGVVGQLFLFDATYQAAAVTGSLAVEMYDVPPPRAAAPAKKLGEWTFRKDDLIKLLTMDERFGRSYTLFLPWPDYSPEVTRVELRVKYVPDGGYPLFAPASKLTIDTITTPGAQPLAVSQPDPQSAPLSPQPITFPTPGAGAMPPLNPLPIGGPAPAPTGAGPLTPVLPPGGLPPLGITAPPR